MVENGMTPMQAIQAATTADADLLGVSQKLGSISTGKLADLIAVRWRAAAKTFGSLKMCAS